MSFSRRSAHGSFNGEFDLVGDVANGGLATTGFAGAVQTNVQGILQNVNTSLWTRIPFNIANPGNYSALTLKMKYNDGFIAYLNGTEIARRNAVSTAWNADAPLPRSDAASSVFEDINISQFIHLLQAGTNVLAIHGQNDVASDANFLIAPELTAISLQPELRYFVEATPGAQNVGGVVGFVGDTNFSHTRGFYTAPISVSITTPTPGATIRYTLDGSDPTATTGTVYSGPISISQTRTLRAAAFLDGYQPSNIDTQTYLFLADIITQSEATPPGWPADGTINNDISYGMDPEIVNNPTWSPQMQAALTQIPSLSLVTPLSNLFDPSTGIYVNASGEGDSWERPTSFELINPDGSPGFQIDAGLRIRGGFSRSSDNPKHAFRLFFKKEYGDGELNFPLFGSEGANEFDKIDLRTAQNYSWSFQGGGGGGNSNDFARTVDARHTA